MDLYIEEDEDGNFYLIEITKEDGFAAVFHVYELPEVNYKNIDKLNVLTINVN